MTKNRIKLSITNDNYLNYPIDGDGELRRIEISNRDFYSHPDRKYYYNIELNNLSECFYIAFGRVTGMFKNIQFSSSEMETFFDECYFKNVVFQKCHFDKIHIRRSKFDNCKFINCSGEISYIRASTFKKNCIFQDTLIEINDVDEYICLNGKRYSHSWAYHDIIKIALNDGTLTSLENVKDKVGLDNIYFEVGHVYEIWSKFNYYSSRKALLVNYSPDKIIFKIVEKGEVIDLILTEEQVRSGDYEIFKMKADYEKGGFRR